MTAPPSTSAFARRIHGVVLAAVWAMALLACVLLAGHATSPAAMAFLDWNPIPADVIALGLAASLLRRLDRGWRRRAWSCVAAALLASLAANGVWLLEPPGDHAIVGTLGDAIYALFYPLIATACALFFVDLGGSFRQWRVWVDVATLSVGLGAIAAVVLATANLAAVGGSGWANVMAYAAGIVGVEVFIALLFVQIMTWRTEASLLWFIAGAVTGGVADLAWATAGAGSGAMNWSAQMIDVCGHYLCIALIATAVVVEHQRRPIAAVDVGAEVSRYSFLPIIAVMSSIALLFGLDKPLAHIAHWKLIAFTLVVAVLVTIRQLGVRSEIHALHRALALREADNRLTELVRRSSDLIAVVSRQGILVYVSPAAEAMLGIAPSQLRLAPAKYLLGPQNADAMQQFLDDIRIGRAANAEMELTYQMPNGIARALQVVGSDQLRNPGIVGLALTVRDVSEQRRLEREVLNDAADERERLAAGIHEGLGQDLTGIALLLKGLRLEPRADSGGLADSIEVIVGHLNRAIDTARTLAQGLSPLQVARGSLHVALTRLTNEARKTAGVEVVFDNAEAGLALAPSVADNLYRIAQEGLAQALRHEDCARIVVTLDTLGEELLMTLEHDGTRLRAGAESINRFGARMIDYRLRQIGGTMRRDPLEQGKGGLRWIVVAPGYSRWGARGASP